MFTTDLGFFYFVFKWNIIHCFLYTAVSFILSCCLNVLTAQVIVVSIFYIEQGWQSNVWTPSRTASRGLVISFKFWCNWVTNGIVFIFPSCLSWGFSNCGSLTYDFSNCCEACKLIQHFGCTIFLNYYGLEYLLEKSRLQGKWAKNIIMNSTT